VNKHQQVNVICDGIDRWYFTCRSVNIVTGFGAEAGQALATSKRIAKLSFTGSTETVVKCIHAENIIPVTMELEENLQIFSSHL
jgi:acyl-CoA reductase-like NAD-dependent aldehyde dehydrogenase